MRKNTFLMNTIILTVTSLFLRIISISFTAFLSNKIGTEGIGLYQLIFSIFILASAFATSGISIAVTRLVAEEIGKAQNHPTSDVLRNCIIISSILSISVAFMLYNLADFIGTSVLNDTRTILAIKILAPSLPFIALTACFRGYFIGIGNAFKSASSSIFEEIVRIVVIMGTINYFIPKGLEYACFAIFFGTTLSEIIACGYSYILYLYEKRKYNPQFINQKGIVKKILSISLPIAASFYLRTGLRSAESILIPSSLERAGLTNKNALSVYGIIAGMVMPLVIFPCVFLFSISTLLIPEIASANAIGDTRRVNSTIIRVLQLTSLLSILFCGIFIFFSNGLGMAIYHSKEAGEILKVLAPLVPLIYLDIVVDAMLNGLNQQMHSLKYSIADSLIRISLLFFLIPIYGIRGFFTATFLSTIINSFFSINRLIKVSKIKVQIANWILKPLLSVIGAGCAVTLLFNIIAPKSLSNGPIVLLEIILTVFFYIVFLFFTQCITKQDTIWLKKLLKTMYPAPKK